MISPIAALMFGATACVPDKVFPCWAVQERAPDPRLRPGMSASAEIIIEHGEPNVLLDSVARQKSFLFRTVSKGAVYIQKGQRFLSRARSRVG